MEVLFFTIDTSDVHAEHSALVRVSGHLGFRVNRRCYLAPKKQHCHMAPGHLSRACRDTHLRVITRGVKHFWGGLG